MSYAYFKDNINFMNNIKYYETSEKNPFNLQMYPNDTINWIKTALSWEDGNWSSKEILSLRKKLMYCFVRKEAHWEMAVWFNNWSKYLDIPKIILSQY